MYADPVDMSDQRIETRPARKSDAPALAELIDMAGEGVPRFLWSQAAPTPEQALAVGAERAARESGGFSYANAHVIERDGRVVALLLGYRQPDPYDPGELDALPDVVRPLVELEALVPGSWYVNAVAALADQRGQGFGSRLFELAHELAEKSGASTLSLIVSEENERAVRLYQRLGYRVIARRPVAPFPGIGFGGDWLLMTLPVAG
jgi:ribosomal protein S18 acetylase RimI-like enzyme